MLIDVNLSIVGVEPGVLMQRMVDSGLEGAILNDRGRADRLPAYLEALEAEGFLAFAAVALPTQYGTLLFLPKQPNSSFFEADWGEGCWEAREALEAVKDADGALLASHPFQQIAGPCWGDRIYAIKELAALECRVGRGRYRWDRMADQVAHQRNIGRLGSCGGDLNYLGLAATVFGEAVETQKQLTEALGAGACWPVEFEEPEAPRDRSAPPPRREEQRRSEGPGRGGRRGDGSGRRPRSENSGRGGRRGDGSGRRPRSEGRRR